MTESTPLGFDPETSTLTSGLDPDLLMAAPVGPKLPWGATKEKVLFPESIHISPSNNAGEFLMQTLFAEFTVLAERKIEQVLEASNEKALPRLLQRGEDPFFDQILTSLNCVAENCLPSLLRCLFEWYDKQNPTDEAGTIIHESSSKTKVEKDYLIEKRDLAVDFLYALALIEVLKQLPYHPGHDDLVNHIIKQAFKHFRYKEGTQQNPNASSINIIADLYAEVIGVLAQSRFPAVKKRLMLELEELQTKEMNAFTSHSIISLLMGIKFFRVKMHPIEDFEMCVQFLHDLGTYFLKVKDRDIKHALAGLFVEILLPVAAVVKNEVIVPVLRQFVEMMYSPTLDLCPRKKHHVPMLPMVTCLLCVSQKQFFLNNWPNFLALCLSKFRDRDTKMARVALESLYRLLWVYMVRIKCESNTATTSRLQCIVNSLFPKGSKLVMPRDMPLNIFVKIIQFIAQERLEFTMKEIIFDLLCVGKPTKIFSPERMSIGLRAFLLIADSLQQKEGEPPMPQTMGVLPSGNTLRFKKIFINKNLSEDTANSIGMAGYYTHVRKAFASILRNLDSVVGKPMLMIRTENLNREPEEIITGERKPKIDLLRTCVAAIPRLLPDPMPQQELIGLLARLTAHMDDELGKLATQSLQNIIVDLPDWRNEVLRGFMHFVENEVTDGFPQLLDQSNRRLISLLSQWKTSALNAQNIKERAEKALQDKTDSKGDLSLQENQPCHISAEQQATRSTLHELEGFALIMLCSCMPTIRKLAVVILKDVRNLLTVLNISKEGDPCVLDVMDKCCPLVIERVHPHLPGPEKVAVLAASVVDFQWLADRTSIIWTSVGSYYEFYDKANLGNKVPISFDPWIECMSIFMHPDFVMGSCPTAVGHAWPILFARLQPLSATVDAMIVLTEGRSTILRGRPRGTTEREMHLGLWKTYVLMGCTITPPSLQPEQRSVSPELNSSPEALTPSELRPVCSGQTARDLFKILVPHIKCDGADIREPIIIALGHINPAAFSDLVEELLPSIKEAIDKKQEHVKKKKKKDLSRLALIRIFHTMAENGIFAQSPSDVMDPGDGGLCSTFVEYTEGAKQFLEGEHDRESQVLQEIRLHFSEFIRHLIRNIPVSQRVQFLSRELRAGLFNLFAKWSGGFGQSYGAVDKRLSMDERCTELELSAVQAMSAVLCCGPAFDPAGLNEDGHVYVWLETLLGSHNEKIYKLAQETIVLLLEFNHDAQTLLDWVVDRCYTGTHEVSDGCFNALAMVFNNREYPCDHVAMLNVTLLNTGCPRICIHETAVQLLHLLYKRFFLDDVVITDQDERRERDDSEVTLRHVQEKTSLQGLLLSGPYSRTQLFLSETLAQLHPDLTMPMFSEITHRFQTAIPSVRQTLLQYLLPWLHNMELVDTHLQTTAYASVPNVRELYADYLKPHLKGEGWGSQQATEMVLNNLFYITAKFGDDHVKEIAELWAALVACWPGNLQVIIRYIVIVMGLGPQVVLPHAKKVIVYLGRAKPDRLVDEILNELRTTEPLNFNVERTQTPPFYRLTSLKKQAAAAMSDDSHENEQSYTQLDKGQIHTKRHSTEDPSRIVSSADGTPRTGSLASLRSEISVISSVTASTRSAPEVEEEDDVSPIGTSNESRRSDTPVPYPLPMPAYGGYFAPLSDLVPEVNLPNPPYQRCNLAVMLLADLIVDCAHIDWTVHLPLMLHIIFLGLDHSRPLIHEHCKKLLLNLLLVLSAHNDHFSVAKVIISNKNVNDDTFLTLPVSSTRRDYTFMEGSFESTTTTLSQPSGNSDSLPTDSVSSLADADKYESTEQVAKALIEFLVTRKCRPLWSYEDITSRVHNIKSAEQLEHFLKYVLRIFKESLPLAHIEQRWAQEALHLALSCSSRHYAGRSFQVFRALHVPVSSSDLSDILSRLVETVAEQGEDMQGYVTEIMLTLEAAVDNLDVDMRPWMKEVFLSTPNLNKEPKAELRKSATITPLRHPVSTYHHAHFRSTSYNLSVIRKTVTSSPPVMETKVTESRHHRTPSGDTDGKKKDTNLKRSTSAQSLKQLQDPTSHDDKLTILSQLFWIAVSLLESDYEYEFLLAVRLIEKILKHMQPERRECKEKLEKILQQMKWDKFPGIQALLVKGCTSPVTAEATWHLLSKLTGCMSAAFIDPTLGEGFPMNVMALLPYLVGHYEEPTDLCIESANQIAQMCHEESPKLDSLSQVMTMYSRGTFGKDSSQWTKCVVKYLYDVYANKNDSMVAFLIETLDKGPTSTQGAVLQILHCVVNYVDITTAFSQATTADLLRVVAKFLESPQWKDALKIIKLCVSRSSTLSAAPPITSVVMDSFSMFHTPFAGADITFKKELPGRTMDFTFDLSHVRVIGCKKLELENETKAKEKTAEKQQQGGGDGASINPSQSGSTDSAPSGWKRPHLSQGRTRERLVNLMNCYGLPGRVMMPIRSPSVIFSHESPSDTLERQPDSVSVSSESVSMNDGIGGDVKCEDDSSDEQKIQAVAAAFNFLDDPEEDPRFDPLFGLSGKRHSMGMDVEDTEKVGEPDESSDDETRSMSPLDDYHQDMPTCPLQTTVSLEISSLRQSLSGSVHSVHSLTGSDLDTSTDLSPSASSPSFFNMAVVSVQSDEIDEIWRSHVNRLMTDTQGTHAANTFHLFARLFHEARRRLYTLAKEACYFLSKSESMKLIATHISTTLDVMTTEFECPLVFVDMDAIVSSRIIEKHKFSLLEIHENYETFLNKREEAFKCLEQMKVTVKLPCAGDASYDAPFDEQRMILCRNLYKLLFYLRQLFEGYLKLVGELEYCQKLPQVQDLSREFSDLKTELHAAVHELDTENDLSPLHVDLNAMSRAEAEKLLLDSLTNKNYIKAVKYIRVLRPLFPGDMFGVHPSDEIEALLFIHCRQQSELKPGVVCIYQPALDLSKLSSRLMEIKVLVSGPLFFPESSSRSGDNQEIRVKTPDSSTL